MMSSKPLSTMDHTSKAEDMNYLKQPRGPGTGWIFRMVTPPDLVGMNNPWTGRPFGNEIRKGLGTRHLVEARKRRDIALSDIRRLSLEESGEGRSTLEQAEEWREVVRQDEADNDRGGVAMVLEDKLEAASKRGVDPARLRRFGAVAFGRGYPLQRAAAQYFEERSPGNRRGFKPLKRTTVLNTETAVRHLTAFLGDEDGVVCLEDVSPALARKFRDGYLPSVRTPRAPAGLSSGTINKNITLLKAIWVWAIDRQLTIRRYRDPWIFRQLTPRAQKDGAPSREHFSASEITALFCATPSGTREGDILRLSLVTGCRVDELAMVKTADIEKDGNGINIMEGKSKNAKRYVPLPVGAQALLKARLAQHGGTGRLFPDWPIRPSVGKVYAISQWFTRFRRQVLGADTDNRLSLHSTRHTWPTVARQARVPEGDIHDVGGWSGPRTSSTVYDHGLLAEQLSASQETIWAQLEEQGFLKSF